MPGTLKSLDAVVPGPLKSRDAASCAPGASAHARARRLDSRRLDTRGTQKARKEMGSDSVTRVSLNDTTHIAGASTHEAPRRHGISVQ